MASDGSSTVRLVPAGFDDLKETQVVYVHKRKAVIVSVEFPLVYYQFEGEDIIKHRSFKNSRDLFEVSEAEAAQRPPSPPTPTSPKEPDTPDTPNSPPPAKPTGGSSDDSSTAGSSSNREEREPSASPGINLLAAFASRPKKVVIENRSHEDVNCDAAAPQGVYISKCEDITVSVGKKVSSLTLHACKNVKVFFTATIQNAEIIKSSDCKVTCTRSCPLWHLEHAADCVITFPGSTEAVSIVSVNSQRTRAIARAEDASSHDDDDDDDDDDDRDEQKRKAAQEEDKESVTYDLAEPQESGSSADNRPQYTTHWSRDSWSFAPLVVLNREGPAGYATNL